MVTKEMWQDWKRNPVTQEFLAAVRETREGKKEEIAEGKAEGNQLYLEIGRCQGIEDCLAYALYNFNYVILEESNEAEGNLV